MEFKDVMTQRRAVNFFDPSQDVPEDRLEEMISIAARAPSSFNLQPWNLMIVRNADARAKLRAVAWDQPKITEAPVVLIVLADRSGWQKDHPNVERNFQEMVASGAMSEDQRQWFYDACTGLYGQSDLHQQAFANKNAGFFAMALMLAAKDLGLDTHPMDGFDHEGVRKAFNIPSAYWIPLLLAVGHFRKNETLMPPKWRKRAADIVVRFD